MCLTYASRYEHALIDRELYLPEQWIADRDQGGSRCREVGVPEEVEFATKPRQPMVMLQRAFDARVPFSWVTADEAYGQVKYLPVSIRTPDGGRYFVQERGLSERDPMNAATRSCHQELPRKKNVTQPAANRPSIMLNRST